MNDHYETTDIGNAVYGVVFAIPNTIHDWVRTGRAILDCSFGLNGMECRVRILNPDTAHKTMSVSEGDEYIRRVQSASGPTGGRPPSPPKPMVRTIIPKIKQEPATPEVIKLPTLQDAQARIAKKNLNQVFRGGVMNKLPRESLTDEDFRRKDEKDFASRVVAVAASIGESQFTRRVSTDSFMRIDGVSSIHAWWSRAKLDQKVRLLTKGRYYKGKQDASRLNQYECPFRDAGLDEATGQDSAEWRSD